MTKQIQVPEISKDREYLVMGTNQCWGRAKTFPEAFKIAEKPKAYIVYSVHPETQVDGMGYTVYPQGETNRPVEIVRKLKAA